jgi:uncharacterized membrane protein
MSIVHLVISLIAAAAVLYYGYLFYASYREIAAEPGEWKPWERLWAAGSGSATKLWARVVGIVGSVIAAIIGLAPMLGAPEVAEFIRANFDPQTVTVVMIGVMIVTEFARNRSA